jgi:ribosomal protein L13
MLNKLLGPLASNINDLLQGHSAFPFVPMGKFCTEVVVLTHEKLSGREYSFNK